jgi:ribonuclease P protein subunit POP4
MATQPTEHIAATILARAHSPDRSENIFKTHVEQRPLLLRPSSPDPSTNARAARQKARLKKASEQRKSNKPRPLSAKQKRALGVHTIPKSQQKYAIYEPLHKLWCDYIREVLGVGGERNYVDAQAAGPMLVSADYHGAIMEVVRSGCVSRVGVSGIVVKDTRFTFEVVTEKNELKILPKEDTVFKFEVPLENDNSEAKEPVQEEGKKALVFELHGNQFKTRAPDRANRKFKMHIDLDL